jgi:hypothetical protein
MQHLKRQTGLFAAFIGVVVLTAMAIGGSAQASSHGGTSGNVSSGVYTPDGDTGDGYRLKLLPWIEPRP